MHFAIESNGEYSDQISAHGSAPSLAAPFFQIQPNDRRGETSPAPWRLREPLGPGTPDAGNPAAQTCQAASERSNAGGEAVGFGLAVLAATGIGALGGWAVVQLFGVIVQAQELVVQNSFLLHR